MRMPFWIGSLLVITLLIGCGQTTPTPAPKPVATTTTETPAELGEPPAQPDPLPVLDTNDGVASNKSDAEMPPPDEEDDESEYSPKREADLLAKLAKNPKDSDVLLNLAKLTQFKAQTTESGDPDDALLKKSAQYLRDAVEADQNIDDDDEFKMLAANYFFNEACAWCREKQTESGLKSLKQAVDYGWTDVAELKEGEDLKPLRDSQEFAAIVKTANDNLKAAVAKAVDAIFSEKHDFKFEFNLKDTDGKPIAKKDFEGKILMVNVWGTWCGPCRKELPDLIAAYDKYKSQGFEIVGLNTENETGAEADALIKESQKKFGINYRCALGTDEVFQQIPDYSAVPTTLFFDRQGKVQAMLVGMANEVVLDGIIERLLKDSPAPKN